MTTLVIAGMALICCLSVVLMAFYTIRVTQQSAHNDRLALSQWMTLLSESQSAAITQVAEAIGQSVRTATFAPPLPPPDPAQIRSMIDTAMDRYEPPDLTDPTDGAVWLAPERDTIAMIDPNDPEPYGIPGLKPLHQ